MGNCFRVFLTRAAATCDYVAAAVFVLFYIISSSLHTHFCMLQHRLCVLNVVFINGMLTLLTMKNKMRCCAASYHTSSVPFALTNFGPTLLVDVRFLFSQHVLFGILFVNIWFNNINAPISFWPGFLKSREQKKNTYYDDDNNNNNVIHEFVSENKAELVVYSYKQCNVVSGNCCFWMS